MRSCVHQWIWSALNCRQKAISSPNIMACLLLPLRWYCHCCCRCAAATPYLHRPLHFAYVHDGFMKSLLQIRANLPFTCARYNYKSFCVRTHFTKYGWKWFHTGIRRGGFGYSPKKKEQKNQANPRATLLLNHVTEGTNEQKYDLYTPIDLCVWTTFDGIF